MSKEQKPAETDSPSVEAKKPRHRSPNYPTVGLREAVNRLREFYKADGKAGAPPDIAAVHIGFSKAHGQAMSVLSALRKFGLIQDINGRVAPTQRGIEILNLSDGDPRRTVALQDAVVAPEIYRQLIEEHQGTGFPSNDSMERELVTYKGFNPNSVAGFVRDLRDSLEFAGITDIGTVDLPPVSQEEQVTEPTTTTPQAPPATAGTSMSVPIEFPVQDGAVRPVFAHIKFDVPMKKEHLSMLRSILHAMEQEFDKQKEKP